MTHDELLINLRKRMSDALSVGMVDEKSHGLVQTLLIQLINDAETHRLNHLAAAERLSMQIAAEKARAESCAAFKAMTYGLLNQFVRQSENAAQEAKAKAAEEAEKATYAAQQAALAASIKVEDVDDEDDENDGEEPASENVPSTPPASQPVVIASGYKPSSHHHGHGKRK